MFRQLTKGEVKQIADIMLGEVFKRAEEKEIKIDVTERFKVCTSCCLKIALLIGVQQHCVCGPF